MAISEAKMKIVIDNYFKAECNVNTSIRQAFEKGFRIGVEKGALSVRKKGKWDVDEDGNVKCPFCGNSGYGNFCPDCGADMKGEQDEKEIARP